MFPFILAVLPFAAAPVPADGENAKALKALEGKWKLVAAEEKGEAANVKHFDLQSVAIAGAVFTESNKGGDSLSYGIKVEASRSPAHLDLVFLEDGKPTPAVAHAIYKLDKDRLTICFGNNITADKPEDRPQEFTTGAERPPKGKVLIVLERVKN